jgi:hypothetical protein
VAALTRARYKAHVLSILNPNHKQDYTVLLYLILPTAGRSAYRGPAFLRVCISLPRVIHQPNQYSCPFTRFHFNHELYLICPFVVVPSKSPLDECIVQLSALLRSHVHIINLGPTVVYFPCNIAELILPLYHKLSFMNNLLLEA